MPLEDQGSITDWLTIIRSCDDPVKVNAAVQALWERYFDRLVRLAKRRLTGYRGAMADEEDVALTTIKSFCRRAADGQFPRLDDRQDLWRLLITIAARKAAALARRPSSNPVSLDPIDLDQIVGREPSPELAATVISAIDQLLKALPDESYRAIARKKLEGYTNQEIAASLGCSTKNVEFKLRNIRATWRPLLSDIPTSEPPR